MLRWWKSQIIASIFSTVGLCLIPDRCFDKWEYPHASSFYRPSQPSVCPVSPISYLLIFIHEALPLLLCHPFRRRTLFPLYSTLPVRLLPSSACFLPMPSAGTDSRALPEARGSCCTCIAPRLVLSIVDSHHGRAGTCRYWCSRWRRKVARPSAYVRTHQHVGADRGRP